MLTKDHVLEQVKAGRKSQCLDNRDYLRLSRFFPPDEWEAFGFKPKEGADISWFTVMEWSRDNIILCLGDDVSFGFDKALNKRGISAEMMHHVVRMWMWILEDPLDDRAEDLYAQYGLPFLKAVALKYGLPNEILDDSGDEFQYSAEAD